MKRDIQARDNRGRGNIGRTRAEACEYFLEKINACEHALPLVPLYKDLVCKGASEKCPVYLEKSGASALYGPGDSMPYEEDRKCMESLCRV